MGSKGLDKCIEAGLVYNYSSRGIAQEAFELVIAPKREGLAEDTSVWFCPLHTLLLEEFHNSLWQCTTASAGYRFGEPQSAHLHVLLSWAVANCKQEDDP